MLFHKKRDALPTPTNSSELPPALWKKSVTIGIAALTLVACSTKEQPTDTQSAPHSETTLTLESSTPASASPIDIYTTPQSTVIDTPSESPVATPSPETSTIDTPSATPESTPSETPTSSLDPTTPADTVETTPVASTTTPDVAPTTVDKPTTPSHPTTSEHPAPSVDVVKTTPNQGISPLVFDKIPERSSDDENDSKRVHNAGLYPTLSPEQKVAFDQADSATFAEFIKLSPDAQASWANTVVQSSYTDFTSGANLGASKNNADKDYFLKTVYPEAMSATPLTIESAKSGPAEYASVLIVDALIKASFMKGETASKIIAALFASGADDAGARQMRDALLRTISTLGTDAPAVPIIDETYLDRDVVAKLALLDNRFVTGNKLAGDSYSVNLNNPDVAAQNIQLTLKSGSHTVDGAPMPYWTVEKAAYEGDPGFDQSIVGK